MNLIYEQEVSVQFQFANNGHSAWPEGCHFRNIEGESFGLWPTPVSKSYISVSALFTFPLCIFQIDFFSHITYMRAGRHVFISSTHKYLPVVRVLMPVSVWSENNSILHSQVPQVAVKQVHQVDVILKMPSIPGNYAGAFKLINGSDFFSQAVWVVVNIVAPPGHQLVPSLPGPKGT